jgi:hypothetical protein
METLLKIVRLKGGLGNQLFILSKALHMSKNEKIILDVRSTFRKDRLPNLELVTFLGFKHIGTSSSKYLLSLLEKLGLLQKCHFYIDDYFQEPSTVENLSPINAEKLCAFLNLFPHSIRKECVVHIRLGDFLAYKKEELLSVEYYNDMITMLPLNLPVRIVTEASREELENSGFQELLNDDRIILSNASDMLTDFRDIARAEFVIGSNSTFSFWAAYLGHSLIKKQKIWMGPALNKYERIF